ncbi:MAG: hypothetical protein ACI8P0_001370 [Planctomycetaceae bacterium]
MEFPGSGGALALLDDDHQIMPRILPIMRIPPGLRSRLKMPTASLCAIAGLVIAWPSGFFGNLVPIPSAIASIGDGVVAKLVSKGSIYLLETAGLFFPLKNGLRQISDSTTIDLSMASGGLRVILAVLAVSMAAAALSSKPIWERLIIVASGFPIAILCGVFRVAAGCLLHVGVSGWLGDLLLFEVAGWLTLAAAWCLLLTERELLSRLLIPPPAREVVPVLRGVELTSHQTNPAETLSNQRRKPPAETTKKQPDHQRSQVALSEPLMRQTEPMLGAAT